MTDKRTVTLEIAGARYRMTSDADEGHLHELAAMVNQRMEDLGIRAARTASPAQMLAVVALGLADDLRSADRRRDSLEGTMRQAVQHAIDRIDRRLEVDTSLSGDGEP